MCILLSLTPTLNHTFTLTPILNPTFNPTPTLNPTSTPSFTFIHSFTLSCPFTLYASLKHTYVCNLSTCPHRNESGDSAMAKISQKLTKESDQFLGEKVIEVQSLGETTDLRHKLGQ